MYMWRNETLIFIWQVTSTRAGVDDDGGPCIVHDDDVGDDDNDDLHSHVDTLDQIVVPANDGEAVPKVDQLQAWY